MPVRQCTGPLPPSPWAEPGCTNLLLLGKSLAFVSLWLCFYRGLFLIYRCSSVFLLTALPGSVHIHLDRHYVGLCMTVSGVTSCKHAQAHLRLCCFRRLYTVLVFCTHSLSHTLLPSILNPHSLPQFAFTADFFPIPQPQKLSQLDKSRVRGGPWGVRNFRDFGGQVKKKSEEILHSYIYIMRVFTNHILTFLCWARGYALQYTARVHSPHSCILGRSRSNVWNVGTRRGRERERTMGQGVRALTPRFMLTFALDVGRITFQKALEKESGAAAWVRQ